jgi:predicted nucleic acid-binding Zn ribbon protein
VPPGQSVRQPRVKGERESALRTRVLRQRGPAGVFGRVVPPSAAATRRAVEAGICPFCGRGPFILLAGHTNRAHAVDRWELRELAGLAYSTSILAPEDRERVRERNRGRPPPDGRLNRGRRHRMSPAGREAQLAGYRRWSTTPEAAAQRRSAAAVSGRRRRLPHPCPVCGATVPTAARVTCSAACRRVIRRRTQAKAARTRAAWRRAAYPDIAARAAAGETQASIAASYGVSRSLVTSILSGGRPGAAEGGAV